MSDCKGRRDRRPGFKRESPLVFYPRYAYDFARMVLGYFRVWCWFRWQLRKIRRDPKRAEYRDASLTPPEADGADDMKLLTETTGGAESVAREKKHHDIIANAKKRATREKHKEATPA